MKNKYQIPKMIVVSIEDNDFICSSIDTRYECSPFSGRYECNWFCKFWNNCRNRYQGKFCPDKEYS